MRIGREQLETLAAVAEEGSFDAAAARLRLTPSAVSQRIKGFEQELGRVLVVRSRPSSLTASGAALLRLARQVELLEHDAADALGLGDPGERIAVPIAVNADSLTSWILPALARVAARQPVVFELHRDDQEHTASLLASGVVMAAVTSQSSPVPGCTVASLGRMRYRAVATPAFVARWFPHGVDPAALASAPCIEFDRKDRLQARYLGSRGVSSAEPPRHYVPASADFARAVELGLGWGMLPDAQADEPRARGALVDLDAGHPIDVPLFWQQWDLRSPLLEAVAAELLTAAQSALEPPVARRRASR